MIFYFLLDLFCGAMSFIIFTHSMTYVKKFNSVIQGYPCAVQTVIMKNSIANAEKANLSTAIANRLALKVTYV
ncbi:hypothetical protein DB44_FX00070 [Candidatus Protochlamydia amoebophila]|uniref:Uncharacterized protein n=1 Tax=Candidatus Protochlamydia amoebophila TaxID=362787 RepID=A0A0C1H769_9BACT|nr:hypothetical protein DB44_FX00070 [Candidatus Protochlamydia amoebophila]